MKKIFVFIIFIYTENIVFSQLKHDYKWVIGYNYIYTSEDSITVGGMILDFDSIPCTISLYSSALQQTIAAISDTAGHLIAYTDGCDISNRNHEIMLNGDTINPGEVFTEFCEVFQYPVYQGALFLPSPASANQYYLFHLQSDDYWWNSINLLYSLIDVSGDKGNGAVIVKNEFIFQDSLLGDFLTATRHANGRDWWLVTTTRQTNRYHVCLLTPDSVGLHSIQAFPEPEPINSICCGQTAFSPDGSLYFSYLPYDGLHILDFNRCTGQFSNPRFYDFSATPSGAGGVAVSPSGQFLYQCAGSKVFQYDLWAPDFLASRDTVAVWDGFQSPFPTSFNQAMLAPDGKIYITSSNTNNILHVIHNPDMPGLACNLEQHGVILPALTGFFTPNFVNYNLGPLTDSTLCDTTTQNPSGVAVPLAPASYPIQVYPNPASDFLHFAKPPGAPARSGWLRLYAVNGKVALSHRFVKAENVFTLPLNGFAKGFYTWEIVWDDGGRNGGRLIVIP